MEFQSDKEKCAKALFFSFDPIDEQKSYELYGHDEEIFSRGCDNR